MGQTKHGKVETAADRIRADLKRAGIAHKAVSVRMPHHGSVHVTIRDASVSISLVKGIAKREECVRRDEYTGEILCGGNTFVDVEYDEDVIVGLVQAIGWRLANAKEGIEVPVGDRRVFWLRDSNGWNGYVSEIGRDNAIHAYADIGKPGAVLMPEMFRHAARQLATDLLDRGIPLGEPSPDPEPTPDPTPDPTPEADADPTVETAPVCVEADPASDLDMATALMETAADMVATANALIDGVKADTEDAPGPVLSPSTCRPLEPFPERVNRYQEKLERRRERLERRAAKARGESRAAFESARVIADGIPMGQPILVGHHSEGRHRRDIARIDRGMRKGIEAADRAAYYESAAASVGTAGVSSDDPEAISKLREQVEALKQCRDIEKHANAEIRKLCKEREAATGKKLTQSDHVEVIGLMQDVPPTIKLGLLSQARAFPWLPQFGGHTQANIRRIEARIAELEAREATPEREPIVGPGYRIEDNKAENRVQVFFDTKPSEEIRKRLKAAGFRWAPSLGVWQRHASNGAWHSAARALGRDV